MNNLRICRGEIWDVQFNPVKGNEQAGFRPALILSINELNDSPQNLVYAVPLTTKYRKIRTRIHIKAGEGGLSEDSYIICEKMRSISHERLQNKRGAVTALTMDAVERAIGIILGIIKAPT